MSDTLHIAFVCALSVRLCVCRPSVGRFFVRLFSFHFIFVFFHLSFIFVRSVVRFSVDGRNVECLKQLLIIDYCYTHNH